MLTSFSFWIAFTCVLLGPVSAPQWHLFYFVPYLVICFYHFSRLSILWRALICGVLLDLLSSGTFFGLTSLNYCLVSWLLYGQTRNFFEDKLSTLPLMTFLFSFMSTLISLILSFFCGTSYALSLSWIATDLIGMSLADSLYALLLFSLPFRLYQRLRKFRLNKKLSL